MINNSAQLISFVIILKASEVSRLVYSYRMKEAKQSLVETLKIYRADKSSIIMAPGVSAASSRKTTTRLFLEPVDLSPSSRPIFSPSVSIVFHRLRKRSCSQRVPATVYAFPTSTMYCKHLWRGVQVKSVSVIVE
jgi:hypothetical protein